MVASPLWLCEHALWACHGLSSILVGATLALPACPLLGYFSNYGFFFPPSNEVIWVGEHTLALATCPQGLQGLCCVT